MTSGPVSGAGASLSNVANWSTQMTPCQWRVPAPGDSFPERHAPSNTDSGALQVGDHPTGSTHDDGGCGTEVVVPRPCCSPHPVVLQQVGVNEHAQPRAVTEQRHAPFGLGNLLVKENGHRRRPVVHETGDMSAVEGSCDNCTWTSSTENRYRVGHDRGDRARRHRGFVINSTAVKGAYCQRNCGIMRGHPEPHEGSSC